MCKCKCEKGFFGRDFTAETPTSRVLVSKFRFGGPPSPSDQIADYENLIE